MTALIVVEAVALVLLALLVAGLPLAAVLSALVAIGLLTAVAGLPPIQREAIVLRYAAGLTAREIGEVIGRSDQATQKLLTRALATIRETYRVDF